jgi:hypothetical protein
MRMLKTLARGVLLGLLLVAGTATTAQSAAPTLSVSALAFEKSQVDATDGVANKLTWTIKDTDPAVTYVGGTVTIRMRSTVTGALLGHEYKVNYSYEQCCYGAEFISGTPQESTYRYTFPVPRYADAATTAWEVVQVTAQDNADRTLTAGPGKLASFGYRFTATTRVDSTGPSADIIGLDSYTNRYVYAPGTKTRVGLDFTVQDGEAGFWKGTLKMAGPAGQSVTTSFQWERDQYSTGVRCGRTGSGDDVGTYMSCGIDVYLPANAAAGSWRVAQLVLVNNAGGRTTYKNPQAASITVTANAVLQASDFARTPETVDTWRDEVTGEITLTVAGLRRGLSSVAVEFDGSGCTAWALPATVSGTTITIPVRIFEGSALCKVTGLALVDGTGTVALYGELYGAPDPGLEFRRVANTTPPEVLGASLDPTTLKASESAYAWITLTVRAKILTAPVNGASAYLYGSEGTVVAQVSGGSSQQADGSVVINLSSWEALAPGEYTVGFSLYDAGRLQSFWNMPDRAESQQIPGGPVTLTVTAD